jgi:hypothetical protein
MKSLRKLKIRAFRGASRPLTLEFDSSKAVVVVFGENGTGKTTVTDALDAVGNCSPGSLKNRSSTKAKEHLPSLGKNPADVEVCLEDAAGACWTTTMSKGRIITSPPELPAIRVLRRTDLLKLVDAPPSERYEVLGRFVDVPEIVRSESTLRDAATDAKKQFDEVVRRRVEAERTLDDIWRHNGSPSTSWQAWAEDLASQKTEDLDKAAKDLRAASDRIVKASSSLDACRRAKTRVSEEEKNQTELQQSVANTPAPDTRAAMDTASLLRKAADFLKHGEHADACPVCRQPISITQLRQDLDTRLSQLQQYETLATAQTRITNDLTGAQVAYERQTAAFAADAIAAHQALAQPAPAKIEGVESLCASFPIEAADWTAESSPLSRDTLRALAKLIQGAASSQPRLQDEEQSLQQQIGQIKNVATLVENHKNAVAESEGLEQQAQRLKRASDIVRETRIAFTDNILESVARETNRLYGLIHPNEPIALSKLELDKARRASLIQLSHFEGAADVPPQAYFSESHLDTLAFCFWLAVAKRESPTKDAVLVLDDIFTSVDSLHLNRISQLIIGESAHFAHVVLTTHQRRWRDVFRYPSGAGKQTQLIELQRWSLARGIAAYQTRLAVSQLIQSITAEPFERQRVAQEAGILLEAILDHLALVYRCRVPRTASSDYTLNELLDGTTSLFKKLSLEKPKTLGDPAATNGVEYETVNPKAAFGKLKDTAFVRNQVGAHYNLTGMEISDAEVKEFGQLAVELVQGLSCTVCGQIPGKKGTSHYECSCPKSAVVRMLPLQL